MFRIAFWNIQGSGPKSGIADWIADLAREVRPDIMALAECEPATATRFLRTVNLKDELPTYSAITQTTRVRIFYRGLESQLRILSKERYEHARYHLLRLDRPAVPMLFACVHMCSLLEKQSSDIDVQFRYLIHEIESAESDLGHSNTIVFGDMNSHPFSGGIAAASGLHGVMSRRVAIQESRKVVFNERPMFYNPMWQFYRGEGTTPQGTYYRGGKGDDLSYFWNLFDQFLFRPSLLQYYRDGQTEILTRIRGRSLLDHSGLPNADNVSDHLPILLTLDC